MIKISKGGQGQHSTLYITSKDKTYVLPVYIVQLYTLYISVMSDNMNFAKQYKGVIFAEQTRLPSIRSQRRGIGNQGGGTDQKKWRNNEEFANKRKKELK